jgi:hypothetical protein
LTSSTSSTLSTSSTYRPHWPHRPHRPHRTVSQNRQVGLRPRNPLKMQQAKGVNLSNAF